MNKKLHLVVSHFEENLDWLEEIYDKISHSTEIFLYSKSKSIVKRDNKLLFFKNYNLSFPKVKIYNNLGKAHLNYLPNVGRESQTYFHHIINFYDNLPDIITFAQGCPKDHFHRFTEVISQEYFEKSLVITLSIIYSKS